MNGITIIRNFNIIATDIAIFLSTKARIVLQNSTSNMVGKVLRKLKLLSMRKHEGCYLYLVRLLKEDDVNRNRRTLEDTDKPDTSNYYNNNENGKDDFLRTGDKAPELPF